MVILCYGECPFMELHTFEKTIGSDGDFGGNLHSNDSGEEELFVKKKKSLL